MRSFLFSISVLSVTFWSPSHASQADVNQWRAKTVAGCMSLELVQRNLPKGTTALQACTCLA